MLSSLRFWSRIASLFLVRSMRATAVLSLMVLAAVSILVFLSSLAVGVNDAMIRNSVSLYSGHITGVDLPATLTPRDLKTEGVANVLKRVIVPGILSHQDLGERIALIGIEPLEELKLTALRKKNLVGRYPHPGENEVMLSQVVADELNVRLGESLLFTPFTGTAPVRLTVAGTYKTGIDQLDRGMAFCPMEAVPQRPDTWSAAIFLEDGVDPETVIAGYRDSHKGDHQFQPWSAQMEDLRQLIDLNRVSMGIVMVLVFGVVSLGIACAFVIFILKNIREYGIMKAMGVTDRETALLIFIEVNLMNVAASSMGILLGVLAVLLVGGTGIDLSAFTSHNRYFAVSGIIFPRLTPYSLCGPPLFAFLSGFASAIWPTVLVARKKAVDILRII